MKSEIIDMVQKTSEEWWRKVYPNFIDKQKVTEEHISNIKVVKNFYNTSRDLISATINIEGYKGKIIYQRDSF